MPSKSRKKNVEVHVGENVNNSAIIIGDNNTVSLSTAGRESAGARFLVPFPHNPDFVGRETELSILHEMLQQGQSLEGIRPTALVGLGGIGKTQLVVEYTHAHRNDYPSGVFWLNAIHPLLIEFSDLAEKLEMADRDTPRDKAARKVWDYLDSHPDTLVIFDNVLEPSELNVPFSPDLVPANLRCCTLFTSRQRDFPRNFRVFEVKVLPEIAAMRLLLRARPEVLGEHHPDHGFAGVICITLGYLPLALALASAYLSKHSKISLYDYRVRILEEGAMNVVDASQVRPEDMPTRHQTAVNATLKTSWDAITDENARLAFRAAGQFQQAEMIPNARLGLVTGLAMEAKSGYPVPLDDALEILHTASLIEELDESRQRLRLHPLVQEFAARLSPASFCLEMAERVAAEFNDLMRLQARVINYDDGIDMALEDVRTALSFCMDRPETETYSNISRLERALDRQVHNLRGWDAEIQPAFFLQQLRNEAFQLDLGKLKASAEVDLAQLGWPYLCERFKVSHESPELVRTLTGHKDVICSVALSTNRKKAVSASWDKTLKVWDVETGCELQTLTGHSQAVYCVVVCSVGQLVISASRDKTLKVWDLNTGRELRTLTGHSDAVYGVAVSSDGQKAISASADKTLKVWNVATGQELCTLKGHSRAVNGVAISADGKKAISASADKTLKVWDVTTGRVLHTLKGHDHRLLGDAVNGVALSADGALAVSASDDKTLIVWDVAKGRELHTLKGHNDYVRGVALNVDRHLAVSASRDNTLKVWDVNTGRELCTLEGHSESVENVALSVDGSIVISASYDREPKIWDISALVATPPTLSAQAGGIVSADMATDRSMLTLAGHKNEVQGVALSADGSLAVSASSDKTLKVWDVRTGRELHTLQGHRSSVYSVGLSADGRLAISASSDNTLKVWNVGTGGELCTLRDHRHTVRGVTLSPDGSLAISVSLDNTLKVWNISASLNTGVATGSVLRTLEGYSFWVEGVALGANGKLTVHASTDGVLKVWDTATGHELCTFEGVEKNVRGVALSADGQLAISVLHDRTLKVWGVATGHVLHSLKGHSDDVKGVAMSADGHLAVSVSQDKTLKIWDALTGQVLSTFPTRAPLTCCAITPDGKTIVAGDKKGGMHFLEWIQFEKNI